MLTKTGLVFIALMAAAAVTTFHIKYSAEERLADIKKLEARIGVEENTIDLLNADWSLLTQPARLQVLVERNREELGLHLTEAHQMVRLHDLPERVGAVQPDNGAQTGSRAR